MWMWVGVALLYSKVPQLFWWGLVVFKGAAVVLVGPCCIQRCRSCFGGALLYSKVPQLFWWGLVVF